MKVKKILISESGQEICGPDDGFILMGNVYKADIGNDGLPHLGLIGNNFLQTGVEKIPLTEVVKLAAFKKLEFLKALDFGIKDLEECIEIMKKEDQQNKELVEELV